MVMSNQYLEQRRKEQIVMEFAPIVEQVAHRLKRRVPDHVEFDELRSVGYIGLMEAIERYDDDKNVPFRVYAEIRINGAMLDYLRKEDWMPRNLRQQAKTIQAVVRELKSAGTDVTDEEIASRLNMTIEEVRQIRGQTQQRVRVSNHGHEDFDGDYLETCVADSETDVVDEVIEQENEARLHEAMHRLPEKEQRVLKLYFVEGQNLREIGEEMGVTESRACQLRKSGVSRLKRLLQQ